MTSSSSSSDEDETLAEIASRSKHDVGSSSDQNHCTSQDEAKEAKIAIAKSKIRDKNITASEGKSDKPLLSNGKDSASYEHINDDNSITNKKSSEVVDSSDSTSKKCKRNYASDTIATASISSVTMAPTATNKKSNAKSQKRDRSQKLSITRPNSGSATQKFTPQQSPRSPRTITFQNQNNQQSSHTLNSQPTSRPGSGKSIDTHPYSRGSVIEVLYIKRKKCLMNNHELRIRNMGCGVSGNDIYHDEYPGGYLSGVLGEKEHRLQKKLMMNLKYWEEDEESFEDWFESSDESSDEGKRGVKGDVRLCDIIDRAPDNSQTGNDAGAPVVQKWKYYVHYRDFNRRMDEWITVDRIVSPPSVGNAKVRALKRKRDEEEKGAFRRKEWERLQMEEIERKRHLALLAGGEDNVAYNLGGVGADTAGASIGGGLKIDVNAATASAGTRKRLRRSASTSGVPPTSFSSNDDVDGATLASGIGTPTNVADIEPTRLTRRQRRRTTDAADIGSNVASVGDATGGVGGSGHGASTSVIAEEHTAVDVVTTIAAQELDEHEGMDEAALKEHEEVTKVKNVATIELGPYQMDTWYFSPLPKELFRDVGMIDTLYVDEFSLNFFTRKSELLRYQAKELPKNRRHPPGNEIYRNGNLSMFEVDGYEERIYCQNLCYIAKLFLDHKTLYFDVDPFLFYVLCEVDERGFHPVGYYSKEKYSDVGYNLACILTFPSHQRKGYGRFLIAFSYELSKKEEKVGSPEKPMSDLGQQAYKPYWTSTIVDFLLNQSGDNKSMSIMDISKETSIMSDDIIFTLNQLGILKFVNGAYFISAERSLLEELAKKHPIKEPRVDPSKLHWTPYITDVKRDKFSIHSKKASLDEDSASS